MPEADVAHSLGRDLGHKDLGERQQEIHRDLRLEPQAAAAAPNRIAMLFGMFQESRRVEGGGAAPNLSKRMVWADFVHRHGLSSGEEVEVAVDCVPEEAHPHVASNLGVVEIGQAVDFEPAWTVDERQRVVPSQRPRRELSRSLVKMISVLVSAFNWPEA